MLPHRCGKRILVALVVLLGAVLLMPKPAAAITPDDPKVKERVKRALAYLGSARDDRIGGECLIGLCFYKAGLPADHPKILQALTRCKQATFNACDNYSLGIALMFLCETGVHDGGPNANRELIEKFVNELYRRQKKHGGWGYDHFETGDTSQTQYAVLGMWMAKHWGEADVPIDKIEAVGGWLMRTQDPSGGWGYQGKDAGSLVRVTQGDPSSPVSPTLGAAGAGALYMVADMLQVTQRVDVENAPKSKALQDVGGPGKKGSGPLTVTLNPDDIKSSLALADRYLGNGFKERAMWNHYYMYALERYQSFRQKAGGGKDNTWYDQGFAHLDRTQMGDGCWNAGQASDNDVTATCFGTLFLLRSAEKSIQKYTKMKMGDGLAVAGMYLPKDIRNIQQGANGKIVDQKVAVPTEQILELINSGEKEEVSRLAEEREVLVLSGNKTERQSQLEQLRKFVGAGDYHVRMLAVTSLSKVRDLDNVPKLIFALTDPDPRIAQQADRGLRFISRKVNGVGLPDFDPTKAQIKAAETAWKDWYLSIRPNAELLD
jgi:hypothetical protein